MKKEILTLTFTLGTTFGIFTSNLTPVFAQLNNSQNPETQFQKNEVGNNESTFGNGFSPLDLIHNSNMRRSRDSGQFAEDTNTGLNQAADKFKRLQQERMQNQPTNPVSDTPAKP